MCSGYTVLELKKAGYSARQLKDGDMDAHAVSMLPRPHAACCLEHTLVLSSSCRQLVDEKTCAKAVSM